MAPLIDDMKAKFQEKRERLQTRVEEVKTKIEERRGGSSSHNPNPKLKIRAEIKEKGLVPALRERMETRRAERLGRRASPEVKVEPEEEGLKFERGRIAIEG